MDVQRYKKIGENASKNEFYLYKFGILLTYSYFGLRPKVLSLEKEKKNEFSFCFLLTYSYLCTQIK